MKTERLQNKIIYQDKNVRGEHMKKYQKRCLKDKNSKIVQKISDK